MNDAIKSVRARQQEFLEVVRGLPWSSEASGQKRIDFIESFFEEAAEEGFADRLNKACLGRK